jgi:hypothetical protein
LSRTLRKKAMDLIETTPAGASAIKYLYCCVSI